MKLIGAAVMVALLADVVHLTTHAPWHCDEDCWRPWRRSKA